MKFGLSLTTSYGRRTPPQEPVQWMVRQTEAARDAGFASLWVGDHHVTPAPYFQNLPTLARLLPHTGEMRVGALFMLPLFQPVLLAEQLGTLDVLSGGRFTLKAALGAQQDAHEAFQIPWKQRVGRFEEALQVLRGLWSQEGYSFEGRYFNFKATTISPRPLQQKVPVWIGADTPPAVQRAARLGDAWLPGPLLSPEERRSNTRVYREALEAFGRTNEVQEFPIRKDIHLAKSREVAREQVRDLTERGYRGVPAEKAFDVLIVDGPEGCIAALEGLRAEGFDHVLLRWMAPSLELILQACEVFATQVMPHFR